MSLHVVLCNVRSYPTAEVELTAESLFGQCTFATFTQGSMDLTMEVQAAAMQASYPARYTIRPTWKLLVQESFP